MNFQKVNPTYTEGLVGKHTQSQTKLLLSWLPLYVSKARHGSWELFTLWRCSGLGTLMCHIQVEPRHAQATEHWL